MATWKRTLVIMFMAQLFSAVGFSITFPFLPLYIAELGSTTGLSIEFLAGMVFSSQALTMMIAGPFWGTVADRYGRKLMVERAMFGGAIILFMMAFVQSAEQLIILRTIQGFITGTISAANALVAAVTPRERMGFAMGTLQVGLWGGVALGPLIGGALADAFGFSIPFFVTAGLLLLAGILVLFGVKEDFATLSTSAQTGFISEWRHVLSMPGVIPTYSLHFLTGLSRSMIMPIMPFFLLMLMPTQEGINTFTGLVVGLSSAAATVTAIYFGRLGDRIGHRQIIVGSALVTGLFYIPQMFVGDGWQLLILHTLAGAASGGLVSSPSALLAHYTEPGEEGAVYGIDNSIVAGARALSPLLGAGLAQWLGYRGVFGVVAVFMVLIVLLALRWMPAQASESQLKTV